VSLRVAIVLAAVLFTVSGHAQRAPNTSETNASATVHEKFDAVDVLTDTQGVDFGPYLSEIIHSIKAKWSELLPEAARAPQLKEGQVEVEFNINQKGDLGEPKIIKTSGDESLDGACTKALLEAAPFGHLPPEFKGESLRLRIHFHYNPQKKKSENP